MFRGILIEKDDSGYRAEIKDIPEEQLPEGDVVVRNIFSSLNYKDALAITGKGPVVRRFPMVPGIDLVGIVETSESPLYKAGDKVILNGWGVGETHWGGLAEKTRLKGEWLIPLPEEFTPLQAMSIGTAGYTAMLCIMRLEQLGMTPEKGEVVVTGASGGVGSIAVSILSSLGYEVVAVSGRDAEKGLYLSNLGAKEVLPRSEFDSPGRPLGRERWAAAIDVVGGHTLTNVCATMKYRGIVAACGLAGGMEFPATVAPFILRGVTLAGVDSVMCPREERIEAWQRLARDLDKNKLEQIKATITLDEVSAYAEKIMQGELRGRVVVDLGG
ncbi:oxidoreductase [Oxalobacter sp. OttesenSCG-928-P03]|nr:oxidoreductase [Oxalobacter sp. OttesenSCG-928-P03]